MKRHLLIDGDIVAYLMACSGEDRIKWGDGVESCETNLDAAMKNTDKWIEEIGEKLDASSLSFAFSDKRTNYFRNQLWPSYKANRSQGYRPVLLDDIKKHLQNTGLAVTIPTLEGDDVLGLMATDEEGGIIVTTDKDLMQIPGDHYNPRKPEIGVIRQPEPEAEKWFHTQILTGDPVDGYPGCPGIGPIKARKILDCPEEEWWGRIVAAYEKAGQTEEDALVQARVARILRNGEWDGEKPVLWEPRK